MAANPIDRQNTPTRSYSADENAEQLASNTLLVEM